MDASDRESNGDVAKGAIYLYGKHLWGCYFNDIFGP